MQCTYDLSVRDSAGNILQFYYGDDGLDPASIEGSDRPVEFSRNLKHSIAVHLNDPKKKYLLPWQILKEKENQILAPRFKGCSEEFLKALSSFIEKSVVDKLVSSRVSLGLSSGLDENEHYSSEGGE